MRAKFEEKTYESYFNNELSRYCDIYFPPGQVQEGSLGFDSAVYSSGRRLWKKVGYPFWFCPPFEGVELIEIASEMERFLRTTIDGIPQMKANLLFQYKKPEYITSTNGREWTHWNTPYYRYDIYGEQQRLLMQIDRRFGNKTLILYACPAMHRIDDLVNAYTNRQIIDSSNFRKASELDGHQRNTFTKSGKYSIACSAPKKIDNFQLIEALQSLNAGNNGNEISNYWFIRNFREQLVSVISEDPYYGVSFNKVNEHYAQFKEYSLLYSHLILSNFKLLTGIQWLVKL